MIPGSVAIAVFSAYVALLLGVALWGEFARAPYATESRRAMIYLLASCIYCSAWSYSGSIGFASRAGLDFLPVFLGPALLFAVGTPMIARIVRLARAQRITSVADFVAARYGKSTAVAATVTVVTTLATLPYIAMQIRFVAQVLAAFVDARLPVEHEVGASARIAAVAITLVFAAIALLVGTRRLDATEHQKGLMVAAAFDAIVKLVAFVVGGICVTWGFAGGIDKLTEIVASTPAIARIVNKPPDVPTWASTIVASAAACLFLPRQFHVSIVENRSLSHIRAAAWFVPLYLGLSTAFVMPIAVAGLALLPPGVAIDRDFTLLALPATAHHPAFALLGLIGAIAASSSAVLVTTTSLAVMASNNLFMPLLLQARGAGGSRRAAIAPPPVLALRRVAIGLFSLVALVIIETSAAFDLSAIGLQSLLGIVQVAPAAVGGLIWRRGNARGAIGGIVAGTLVLAYTWLLPLLARTSPIVADGPLGFDALRPTDLFGLDLAPFAQSVLWSVGANVLAYVVLSLTRAPNTNERLQANVFIGGRITALATSLRFRHATVRVDELLATVGRYLDADRAYAHFAEWHASQDMRLEPARDADPALIQYAEVLIASSIGTASSRIVMSLLLRRREMSEATARQIVDDAAFEIQNSRDMLQHAIDVARDGMAVYDADLRLVAWNRAYRDMFRFPDNILRIGTPLDALVRLNAERGIYGEGPIDDYVAARLEVLTRPADGQRLYSAPDDRVLEMRSMRLHNGGLFFTYSDATARVSSEEELEAENMTLEQRVHERTEELERLNVELIRAKAEAEDANISKSRFLAAASHDLLQPLSAARLYATSLRERLRTPETDMTAMLAANVDASLEAVEDILGALLEISHLDAGATKTEIAPFVVGDLLAQLKLDFEPLAHERGLRLRVVASTLPAVSDRRLLRRMLQNLISNAIKYTLEGSVLIGVRRHADRLRIDVYDTGIGIPASKTAVIFREFERLPAATHTSPGAGLGLSIVERLGRVLNHEIGLRSTLGRGSRFSVTLPRAQTAFAPQSETTAGISSRGRSLEGMTVAAIDNDPDILAALEALLQGWDCFVAKGVGLEEVEHALDRLGRAPDVIVADYHIGEIDGLEVVAALRRRFGPRPALLVTADQSPVIRDLATAADVRVLHKPVKPAALRSLLSQWHLVKAAAE